MILYKLFLTFLKIGAFSFGGGYAMIPFIQREVIEAQKWISMQDFANIIAIAEMTPGPIAVNSATFVGYQVQGVLGSSAATLGVVLPSLLIGVIVSRYFFKFKDSPVVQRAFTGIRPIVLALIIVAAISVGHTSFSGIKDFILFGGMLLLLLKFDFHPMLVILISGVIGVFVY